MASARQSPVKPGEKPTAPLLLQNGVQGLVDFERAAMEMGFPPLTEISCFLPFREHHPVPLAMADKSGYRYDPMEMLAQFNVPGALQFHIAETAVMFGTAQEKNLVEIAELLGDNGQDLLIAAATPYGGFPQFLERLRARFATATT